MYIEEFNSWILSNFKKHLVTVHQLKQIYGHEIKSNAKNENLTVKTTIKKEIRVEDTSDLCIIEEVEVDVDENEIQNNNIFDGVDTLLYNQLAAQITEMITATLTNNEKESSMHYVLNESMQSSLSVVHILGDGNCLFGAIFHQIHRCRINSKEHQDGVKKLRADVVKFILEPENFASYQYTLQDRVYELKSAECKEFVRNILSKDGFWGGHETIMAASNIYQTNIIIINENGHAYLASDNQIYTQTIAIAFRTGYDKNHQVIRNHYDSVCEINSADISVITESICKRLK